MVSFHNELEMARKIILENYNPKWVTEYICEAKLIEKAIGDLFVSIHHIGSTSIPDICAKPIIDILVEVTDIGKVDERNSIMVELGYEPRGELGISGRRYFSKGENENRSHHIHIFQKGSPHITRHLNFRDYLRCNTKLAKEYCRIKRDLAKQYPEDIESYTEGKSEFIQDIEKRALEWRCSIS